MAVFGSVIHENYPFGLYLLHVGDALLATLGQVIEEVSTGDLDVVACALGGADGRTLFLCTTPDFRIMPDLGRSKYVTRFVLKNSGATRRRRATVRTPGSGSASSVLRTVSPVAECDPGDAPDEAGPLLGFR